MKKIAILSISLLFFTGCSGDSATTTTKVQQNQNVNSTAPPSSELPTVSSHSQATADPKDSSAALTAENNSGGGGVTKSDAKTNWTQSGNPIDTTGFDSEIKQAQDKIKSNSKDETLKTSLADAYVARAMALTEARQYASALGDYRKALKLDPENETAKQWIGQIIGIYEGINRAYPKEGEEPPPLPFKKS